MSSQAIVDACQDGTIPNASVVRVVHNILKAYGAVRAKNASMCFTYYGLIYADCQLRHSNYLSQS